MAMKFIRAVVTLVALVAGLLPIQTSDARFPRGTFPASGFNGGKMQTNVSALQTGGAFPFLNQLKQAQEWSRDDNLAVDPSTLDSNGYPTSLPSRLTTVFFIPTQAERPGNYVLTATGNGTAVASGTVLPTASFTGSVTSNVLTAGAPTGGTIQKGMTLSTGGTVGNQLTGSPGVAGTYALVNGVNAGSQAMTVSGGSLTGSGGSIRFVFSPASDRMVAGVSATSVTDMKIFHVDDEAALIAGEVFSTKFKDRLREGGFGIIRFLGWYAYGEGMNVTNVATWAMRKPQSYVFYDGHELRPSNYAGSTSLTGQAYSVGNPPGGFTLTDKAWVHALYAQSYPATQVSFTNGSANITMTSHGLSINSQVVFTSDTAGNPFTLPANFTSDTLYYVVATPNANTITVSATQGGSAIVASGAGSGTPMANPQYTMNVNGTGAKRVINNLSEYTTAGSNSRPRAGTYQSLTTLIYDAGLDAYLQFGGTFSSSGVANGVPPELMIRLCAEVGAHPWIEIPFLGLDPMTDYAPEFISYTKNYPGAGWMVPRIEASNEVWNIAGSFYGTHFANAKAPVNWPGVGANYMDWYGKVSSTLGQTAANIYGVGTKGTAYHVISGVQTFTTPSDSDERMLAAKYVNQAAAAQSLTWSGGTINFTKSAASGWVTRFSTANYTSPSEYGSGTETTRSNAFAGVRFQASIANGTMTVTQIDTSGGTLAIGKTIFGRGIAGGLLQSGVTITGGPTGSLPAQQWTLSSSITLAADTFYAATDITQPGLYIDSLAGSASGFNLAAVNAKYTAWASWAAGYGITKNSPYEGGYSPDFSGGGTSAVDILRYAGRLVTSSPGSATGLQGYTFGNSPSNYGNLVAASGEFPSLFLPTGEYPTRTVWNVLINIYEVDPPQWKAAKAFN